MTDEPITAKMTIGKRLRCERLARGVTQRQLAERSGTHRPNIARLESCVHTPDFATVERYVEGLGCHLDIVLKDKA